MLAAKNDAEAFVSLAKRLIRNELQLNKCRNNATHYAESHSWESIVDSFENLMASISDRETIALELAS
jgi:hypothetical protein